jgi:hypothetical protein
MITGLNNVLQPPERLDAKAKRERLTTAAVKKSHIDRHHHQGLFSLDVDGWDHIHLNFGFHGKFRHKIYLSPPKTKSTPSLQSPLYTPQWGTR